MTAPRARVTGNLSAELTSFVGRRDELAEIRRLLASSRLVTLTGIGGVGKTQLALRAAGGLCKAFRDGVWLVQLDQLRQLRDEELVAEAVAGALGLQDRAGYDATATRAEYLAERQLQRFGFGGPAAADDIAVPAQDRAGGDERVQRAVA